MLYYYDRVLLKELIKMKVLLLEDDFELCQSIKEQLIKEGYIVDSCPDGETAMLYALNTDYAYDIAIVDRMLPIIDGLSIIKAMRQKNIQIPVIIITGMSNIDDRIDGLDGGADDYLIKPFHMKELLARIRALTRRPAEIQDSDVLTYADLSCNRNNRKLLCNNKSVDLTFKESELLQVFMQHPGRVFSREQLVLRVWGTSSDVEQGNVDNYISFLRNRLKELNCQVELKTVYGTGYRLESKK